MPMIDPLVSVLLCTHNSRALLPIAIESYLSQNYSNRELVVIDDGHDLIQDMVRDIPGVRYHLFPADNLAQKRNAGVRAARGDIIVHFDSDDWSGPDRIHHQVEELRRDHWRVVGYGSAFWYDTRRKVAAYPPCWLWGATLCYERNWALQHPWNETARICEDVPFLEAAREVMAVIDGGSNFVALAHEGNAARPFGEQGWELVANETLPAGFRKLMGLDG